MVRQVSVLHGLGILILGLALVLGEPISTAFAQSGPLACNGCDSTAVFNGKTCTATLQTEFLGCDKSGTRVNCFVGPAWCTANSCECAPGPMNTCICSPS